MVEQLFETRRQDAGFSRCGAYRYWLTRWWGDPWGRLCCWIMLNPSTADAEQDDPTIRRCIGFSKRWGFDGLAVVNLFSLRATDPRELRSAVEPIGLKTDDTICEWTAEPAFTVAAWGSHGEYLRRGNRVADLLRRCAVTPYCLGTTKAGQPKHPLYLRSDTEPVPYEAVGEKG